MPTPFLPVEPIMVIERAAEMIHAVTTNHQHADDIKETDRDVEGEHTTVDIEQTDAYGTRTRLHAERTVIRYSSHHSTEPAVRPRLPTSEPSSDR